ncbi:Hypothetical predicted protein [Mytilus galloprovincialis]|uniref:Transposase domain-containing protein n=1 Tax=Mytilus galloprovincialis TaxID=29158 RepID=A0A8B6FXG4_MYTGA|nr:Hypothetical predicted protein [Mytilus galloprovincialis]
MDDTCTSRKQYRKEYKRQWIAASRALRQSSSHAITQEHLSDNYNSDVEHHFNHEQEVEDVDSLCSSSFITCPQLVLHEPEEIVSVSDNSFPTIDLEEDDSDLFHFHSITTDIENILDSDEEDFEKDTILANDLAQWVNENSIEHNAVDALLGVLKKHGHSSLPLTARTLLGTMKNVTTEIKSGMEYIFFVALTLGRSKPSNLDFLRETIRELDNVLQNGFPSGNRTIKVNLKGIVCDAPARAFVKGTKLYCGYYGCDKCAKKGNWIGRMTYQDINNLTLRTNETFRNSLNQEHHNYLSPFCDLPMDKLDMIKQFPLDYMHLVCLGVMKKLLLTWKRGKLDVRLSNQQVQEIGRKLVRLRSFVPEFFARKPRNMDEIDRWKATEFRQFLLYTGKIVLKDILRSDMYKNFMALSVGISILVCSSSVQNHADYAHNLLEYFVESARIIYGPEFLVYNVHSLLHITDEAKEYGNLDECSAFAFENYLQKLKKMVRSGRSPMVSWKNSIVPREKKVFEGQVF